ncbi:hypothetical protein SMACR_08560 [Sordaria macrospora]|uniref:WGS project CABT00000000 data, contig 2.59 n=2 Tax=Sordaria macrospora TaxID=5147 RepID=F7WAB4_SORMK|nr:uncharacterized protein SMAC_08560 [Sordaria macrospora k-hell]KAA8635605.1 hypothetical protein SMACR_08560 [Sordaria macrospora]CCC05308.1 unnamed protein product [Sordaria macrospora k-hell]
MSGNDEKRKLEAQYFPPPPPGGPPLGCQQPPRHPDEVPIPDYNPSNPQYAPREDIYGLSPTDEHPPPFPPRPTSSGKAGPGDEKVKLSWGQKLAGWGTKAAAPINALANKMGSEAFLPGPIDKEVEKAARILRSFCKDGIYSDAAPTTAPPQTTFPVANKPVDAATAKKKSRVLLTIPSKVIAKAQGLAIFTTVRAGFQVTGASGSGILIARLPDGRWSPPSGIHVHSIGAGFVVGLDIYDCVVVINSKEALEAFTRTRLSLGSDLAVTAGPWGAGGALDWGVPQGQKTDKGKGKDGKPASRPTTADGKPILSPDNTQFTNPPVDPDYDPDHPDNAGKEANKNRKPSPFVEAVKKPVYSYVKSRGFYAGVQVDGTVITERKDANAVFYGRQVTVQQILNGEVPPPPAVNGLFEVLKGAEGWRGQQGQQFQQQQTVHMPQGHIPQHHVQPTPVQQQPYPGQGQQQPYPGQGQQQPYPGQGQQPSYPGQGQQPSYPGQGQQPSYQPQLLSEQSPGPEGYYAPGKPPGGPGPAGGPAAPAPAGTGGYLYDPQLLSEQPPQGQYPGGAHRHFSPLNQHPTDAYHAPPPPASTYNTGGGPAEVSGVTSGIRGLDLNSAGPSIGTAGVVPPAPGPQASDAARAKAAEAAAESAAAQSHGHAHGSDGPPPPSYEEFGSSSSTAPAVPGYPGHPAHPSQTDGVTGGDELPPAYVEDGVYRPDVGDHKRQQ